MVIESHFPCSISHLLRGTPLKNDAPVAHRVPEVCQRHVWVVAADLAGSSPGFLPCGRLWLLLLYYGVIYQTEQQQCIVLYVIVYIVLYITCIVSYQTEPL